MIKIKTTIGIYSCIFFYARIHVNLFSYIKINKNIKYQNYFLRRCQVLGRHGCITFLAGYPSTRWEWKGAAIASLRSQDDRFDITRWSDGSSTWSFWGLVRSVRRRLRSRANSIEYERTAVTQNVGSLAAGMSNAFYAIWKNGIWKNALACSLYTVTHRIIIYWLFCMIICTFNHAIIKTNGDHW